MSPKILFIPNITCQELFKKTAKKPIEAGEPIEVGKACAISFAKHVLGISHPGDRVIAKFKGLTKDVRSICTVSFFNCMPNKDDCSIVDIGN